MKTVFTPTCFYCNSHFRLNTHLKLCIENKKIDICRTCYYRKGLNQK